MSAQEEIGEKEERKIMRSRILGAFREAQIQLITGASYQRHCYLLENVRMRFRVNNMVDFILSNKERYKTVTKEGKEYIALGGYGVSMLLSEMDKASTPLSSPTPTTTSTTTTSPTFTYGEWRKTYKGNIGDIQFHYANHVRKTQGKQE